MAVTRLLLSGILPWKWSQSFYPIDDVVMGGISHSKIRFDGDGSLVFEGELRTENNGGFASTRSDLTGVDRSLLTGGMSLVVRTRGDGNRYKLRATNHGNFDGVYYSCDILTKRGEVTTSHCPVASMRPTWRGRDLTGQVPPLASTEDIKSLGFMITKDGGQKGVFQLEVLSVAVECQ